MSKIEYIIKFGENEMNDVNSMSGFSTPRLSIRSNRSNREIHSERVALRASEYQKILKRPTRPSSIKSNYSSKVEKQFESNLTKASTSDEKFYAAQVAFSQFIELFPYARDAFLAVKNGYDQAIKHVEEVCQEHEKQTDSIAKNTIDLHLQIQIQQNKYIQKKQYLNNLRESVNMEISLLRDEISDYKSKKRSLSKDISIDRQHTSDEYSSLQVLEKKFNRKKIKLEKKKKENNTESLNLHKIQGDNEIEQNRISTILSNINEKNHKISSTQNSINFLKQEIKTRNEHLSSAENELKNLENEKASLNNEISSINSQISTIGKNESHIYSLLQTFVASKMGNSANTENDSVRLLELYLRCFPLH